MAATDIAVVVYGVLFCVVLILMMIFGCRDAQRESQDRRVARVVLAPASAAPAPPVTLPYFPYAQGKASESLVCAICLELLRHGDLCSEVPACRHLFHKECIDVWGRSSNSCPLCRVKIVPGSRRVSAADDMV